jgi:hypothetical protein
VVLDRHVLAVDKTGFVEPFAERSHKWRGRLGRPAIDKSDRRHRRLLRPRRERPRSHAAEGIGAACERVIAPVDRL